MTSQPTSSLSVEKFKVISAAKMVIALFLVTGSSVSQAQEVRWSYFEVSFVQQDVGEQGFMADLNLSQSVEINASDGDGIKFRASLGTWHNLFAFLEFNSSDIDVDAVVTNSSGDFPASDKFDYTHVRGGVGLKWALTHKTDVYGAVSYDSTDFDFGSFAGENFDSGDKDFGAEIGVRSMLSDKFEVRVRGRHTNVGAADLSVDVLDSDTLFGAGFGYEVIRGLSIVGDFESGEYTNWNLGFRLDLSED